MALNPVLTRTASDIIESSLRRARIIPVRQPVSSIDFTTGMKALNNFVAKLRSQGWHLWKTEEYVLFLEQGKTDYFIGPSGDNAAFLDDFIQDALAVATVPTDTQLTISDTSRFTGSNDVLAFSPTTSTAGWSVVDANVSSDGTTLNIANTGANGYAQYQAIPVTAGEEYFFEIDIVDTVGIVTLEVYSGLSMSLITSKIITGDLTQTIFFTSTEASVILRIVNDSPTGDTDASNFRLRETNTGENVGFRVGASTREWNIVTRVLDDITIELKNVVFNAAAVGESVFAYKNLPDRPLKITNHRSKNAKFDSEININTWSRSQYMMQTIKNSQGLPTQAYYQPELVNGRMYIWQVANDVDQLVLFSGDTPLEVTTENSDNPDFPAEWFEMLSWGLASLIGPEYGIPDGRQNKLDAKAFEEKEDALDWDEEGGSLLIGPDNNGRN